jgi:hypothetical protein
MVAIKTRQWRLPLVTRTPSGGNFLRENNDLLFPNRVLPILAVAA